MFLAYSIKISIFILIILKCKIFDNINITLQISRVQLSKNIVIFSPNWILKGYLI